MYLSDRDLKLAVEHGQLIVEPRPVEYDTTSIDLHLDSVETARVWNAAAFEAQQTTAGQELAVVGVGRFDSKLFAKQFHMPVPQDET